MREAHGEEEVEYLMDRLSGKSALRVIRGKNGETPLSELNSFLSVIWYVVSFRQKYTYGPFEQINAFDCRCDHEHPCRSDDVSVFCVPAVCQSLDGVRNLHV